MSRNGSTPLRALDPWSDERTVATLRLVLALAVLAATALTLTDAEAFTAPPLVALGAYAVHSAVVAAFARRGRALTTLPAYWMDVGWYTGFIALGGGSSSPFFAFYFFAILVASFRAGARAGLRVTVASAVLSSMAGYLVAPLGTGLSLDRFVLRPIYLVVIGILMARLGDLDLLYKRRLTLLTAVSATANPRFGEGQTLAIVLERLRAFHDADAALLAVWDARAGTCWVRRAHRGQPEGAAVERPVTVEEANVLAALPEACAVACVRRGPQAVSVHAAHDPRRVPRDALAAACSAIASALPCRSFISAPMRYGSSATARVYVASSAANAFTLSDAEFLAVVLDHVMPAIQRVRLLDRLAIDAAMEERQRLARDLHDSVMQPYIGLEMGIGAALQHARDGAAVVPTLERLLHVTRREIANLRDYARAIKARRDPAMGLAPGVRRIAERFAEAAEIRVEVRASQDLAIEDRLSAHVFHMVAEGLSNIRRHTTADRAVVRLERRERSLHVRIENSGDPRLVFQPFVPRSIVDRATALGGTAHVLARPGGGAVVEVSIPL